MRLPDGLRARVVEAARVGRSEGRRWVRIRPADVDRFHRSVCASVSAPQSKGSPSGMLSVNILASTSRSATARRPRFSRSRARGISAATVRRVKPCSRAARAPTRT